jgi:hypothetical protein
MSQSVTDWLHESRVTVVAIDPATRRLRVKGAAEACTDWTCHAEAEVVADDTAGGLEALYPGDIVRLETRAGRAHRIVVVRRVWDEIGSPEF